MTPLLLRGGQVFDGSAFCGVQDVLLVDGLVSDGPVPAGARVIDCTDATVLPGIIDAHVHVAWAGLEPPPQSVAESRSRALQNMALLLAAGVTTVRDVGGPLDVLGTIPDLLFCGRILCAPGGHGTEIPLPVPIAQECSGQEGFASAVREQLAGGASAIKVSLNGAAGRVQLSADELAAVVEAAHAEGARVAAHASVHDAVALAVACGVDTIEHGNGLTLELAHAMQVKGIALVPTVAIFEELRSWDDSLLPEERRAAHRCAVDQRIHEHGPALEAALLAEVTIAFGTDRVPGGEVVAVVEELEALRRHGMTTEQVLRAATTGSAEALGLSDRGSLRPGQRADVIVVPGDLSDGIEVLRTPSLVVVKGHPVSA